MYLRRSCDVGLRQYKKSFDIAMKLFRCPFTSAVRNKIVYFSNWSLTSNNTNNSDFLQGFRKPDTLICFGMKSHDYRSLHNNKDLGTSNKSTKIEGENKSHKAGATTENKTIDTGKKQKFKPKLKPKKSYSFLKTQKYKIIAVLFAITSVFYVTHLVVDPITERKKFHLFSESQTRILGNIHSERYKNKYKDRIETSGTYHSRVSKVVTSLMKANSELPGTNEDRSWAIFVIDRKDVMNSYVFANGDIFVFTGLLEAAGNDDHLAAVFSHQIAHVLLNHSSETPTFKRLLLSIILYPLISIYEVSPRIFGFVMYPILRKLSIITMKRPMGKKLEREADRMSVVMVSNACYDPRKVKEFWMSVEDTGRLRRPKLLRMHPNDKMRGRDLDSLMPKAFNILNKRCAGSLHPFFR